MSKNIDQVYIANPITSNASTDLMYFGQSPYGAGNDAAMTYANFAAQILAQIPSAIWNDVITTPKALVVDQGFITDNGASLVTYTLPTTAAIGTIIEISGKSSGGWIITYTTNQIIHVGNQTTTLTTGSLASTNQWDYVKLLCVTANVTWNVIGGVGNLTVV